MSRATRFLAACRGKKTDCMPVWLMRQAGRYQPSYRELRQHVSFFELCQTPELAARVTVAAVQELDADAAIIFSDILVPLMAMGAEVGMSAQGPKLSPLRSQADIDRLALIDPEHDLDYVMAAIRLVNRELDGSVPQIGFAGAPLTLASYLVEGGSSRSFAHLKGLLFSDPSAAQALLEKLATVVARHLRAQVDAGAHAVQLFDTWAGILSRADYKTLIAPHVKRIFDELADLDVPRIFFATHASHLLDVIADCGPDVIGVDWTADLSAVAEAVQRPLQGNLDPCYLFTAEDVLETRIRQVLAQIGERPHVFNLGHGILPQTDPARARFLVDTVHRLTAAQRSDS